MVEFGRIVSYACVYVPVIQSSDNKVCIVITKGIGINLVELKVFSVEVMGKALTAECPP